MLSAAKVRGAGRAQSDSRTIRAGRIAGLTRGVMNELVILMKVWPRGSILQRLERGLQGLLIRLGVGQHDHDGLTQVSTGHGL